MSVDDETASDAMLRAVAAAPAVRPPATFRGNDRFAVSRRLGEGTFGVVYEATDRKSGSRVALKLLRRPTADWLYRFKREFRALADFSHPNVVPLYELGNVDDDWFFTMQLVEGEPFLAYARQAPEQLAAGLGQLARGLDAMHAAGIIHRDVKPSNVLVGPSGHVTILDFGLAVEAQAADASAVAGTPLYMAPEQLSAGALSPAADWYSVGVMLYQALTGRAPFHGSIAEMVAAKLREEPELVSSHPLANLCRALLARDVHRRAGATAILAAVEPSSPAAPEVRSDPFVGREVELSRLLAAVDALKTGRPGLAFVSGTSGIGKSALLRRFTDEVRRRYRDGLILVGRCFERETVPFKALDGAIDSLARTLRGDPQRAAWLPRDGAALVRLFPVLSQIDGISRGATGADGELDLPMLRARGTEALRELLGRIADRRRLVIVVDDLQWGDADSARLLADLIRGPGAASLLFVGATREGEESSAFWAQLAELRDVGALQSVATFDLSLEPLASAEARRLLADLLPAASSESLGVLIAEAAGSPFFLGELARHTHAEDGAAPRLDDVIQRRLRALSTAARRLLDAAAVAARPTATEVLHETAGGGDLSAVVAELRAARFLRARDESGEQRLEVYHDRIRESVVAVLDGTERLALHRRLAAAYEQRGEHERVAVHLREAGDTRRAAELIVMAAQRAAVATAFEQAARLYREALALFRESGGLPRDEELALERAVAESLSSAGRCAEAADAYLSAASLCEGTTAIQMRSRAAEELLQGGHLARGREILSSVVANLGLKLPSSPARGIAAAVVLRAWLKLRGGLERPLRAGSFVSEEAAFRLDTLWTLTWAVASVEPALMAALAGRFALLALDAADPFQVTRALVMEAMGAANLKSDRDGGAAMRALERAQQLLPRCNRPEAEPALLLGRGMTDMLQGRFVPAVRHFNAADSVALRNGLHRGIECTWPALMRSVSWFWMGSITDLLREAPRQARQADERGNLFAWTMFQGHYAYALVHFPETRGALQAMIEEVPARWSGVGTVLQHYWFMLAAVIQGLASDDSHAAWRAIVAGWPELQRQRILMSAQHKLEAQWLRGRAALRCAAARGADQRAMLAEVERTAQRIEALRLGWGRGFSASLRGGAAIIAGDPERAVRLLAEAEAALEPVQVGPLLAAVRDLRGRLIGGASGDALRAAAEQWRVSQGLPSLELVHRLHLPTG